ncbi:hypothetical protein BDF20DRAFT_991662 [Mycotypha africana]|uniref:uncharacterized protein n=1 Tax=Mycotypha africana TaxID=64632 RepID=UPI002300B508|nr:uncharacterized protein BDF20DRAFT_991662 [Mycotypha africana]KAI8968051.1 hypothetical protein BDF20DRAFT_991662 [Mycotypha africana]
MFYAEAKDWYRIGLRHIKSNKNLFFHCGIEDHTSIAEKSGKVNNLYRITIKALFMEVVQMSTNKKSHGNLRSSTSAYKSCYRLYAGHGNWINLSEKTTQDLLTIFQKGEPCRYQLAPGLYLSIIPNDVDCNSKNIDMIGLMRADLVCDGNIDESHAQQSLSHYVRSLLDEQGIIDAFPPVRPGQDLPTITSLSTHRHLSLVPSVVSTVRRGPKPSSQPSNMQIHYDSNSKSSTSSSSASSFRGGTDEENINLSSSASSLTQSSFSSSSNRKRISTSYKKVMKKPRLDTIYSMDVFQRRAISPLELSSSLAGTPYSSCLPAPPLPPVPIHSVTLTGSHQQHHYYSHNNSESNSSNILIPPSFHQQHLPSQSQHQHHYFSSQPHTPPPPPPPPPPPSHSIFQNTSLWLSASYQQNSDAAASNDALILPTLSRPSHATAATTNDFNINFSVEFDHRQSPTDILNEYDNNFSNQMNSSSFDAEVTTNGLYSSSSIRPSSTATGHPLLQHTDFRQTQQQHHDIGQQHNSNANYPQHHSQQQQSNHRIPDTSTDNNSNSLEGLLPDTSPIALEWPEDMNTNDNTASTKHLAAATAAAVGNDNKILPQDSLPSSQSMPTTAHWHHSLSNYIHSNNLNKNNNSLGEQQQQQKYKRREKRGSRKGSATSTIGLGDVEVFTCPSSSKKNSILLDDVPPSEDNDYTEATTTVMPVIDELMAKSSSNNLHQLVVPTCIKQEMDNSTP